MRISTRAATNPKFRSTLTHNIEADQRLAFASVDIDVIWNDNKEFLPTVSVELPTVQHQQQIKSNTLCDINRVRIIAWYLT